LIFSTFFANQDHWKGDEYAKNSKCQKASADDFMHGSKFKGSDGFSMWDAYFSYLRPLPADQKTHSLPIFSMPI